MNNYLLESLDSLSLQKEREKIIHSEGFDSATISLYDMEESILDNALEDLDTYGFLTEKKVVLHHNVNCWLFLYMFALEDFLYDSSIIQR